MSPIEELQTLEEELLKSSTRKNAERVSSLLAEGFREFGSSGQSYTKAQVIAWLQSESLTAPRSESTLCHLLLSNQKERPLELLPGFQAVQHASRYGVPEFRSALV